MANFESFSRRMLPLQSDPCVTIQKRGSMSLNRSAFEALGSPGSVELLYDRDAAVIGLRPTSTHADNAYHVRGSGRSDSGPWLISAMAFVKFYGIDVAVTRRWPARLEDGVLCVDLTAQASERGGRHA